MAYKGGDGKEEGTAGVEVTASVLTWKLLGMEDADGRSYWRKKH